MGRASMTNKMHSDGLRRASETRGQRPGTCSPDLALLLARRALFPALTEASRPRLPPAPTPYKYSASPPLPPANPPLLFSLSLPSSTPRRTSRTASLALSSPPAPSSASPGPSRSSNRSKPCRSLSRPNSTRSPPPRLSQSRAFRSPPTLLRRRRRRERASWASEDCRAARSRTWRTSAGCSRTRSRPSKLRRRCCGWTGGPWQRVALRCRHSSLRARACACGSVSRRPGRAAHLTIRAFVSQYLIRGKFESQDSGLRAVDEIFENLSQRVGRTPFPRGIPSQSCAC